jgi:hypothetical protein
MQDQIPGKKQRLLCVRVHRFDDIDPPTRDDPAN